ncbi:YueH family protein [Litchfieldia salsa]|uniref:YueH family protein n=1 Tax=Litchfieldia salsa TaxID=930152 RepID=UPI000B866F2C|nr:YueH family protein [Litchfieldia salsa]
MKIRKAMINETTESVFIYENKKEEYTLVAIPSIQWSTIIQYEEETAVIRDRVHRSLVKVLDEDTASLTTNKITHWVREM